MTAAQACANCDTPIGRLETPYVFNDHVVCAACYARLAPVAYPTSQPLTYEQPYYAPPVAEPQSESVYLQNADGVLVTTSRVVLRGTTYALRNIASVSMGRNTPSRLGEILLVGAGALGCATGILRAKVIYAEKLPTENMVAPVVVLVISFVILAFGIMLWFARKPTFVVRLSSSSGEVDGLVDDREPYVRRIVSAISQAITERR